MDIPHRLSLKAEREAKRLTDLWALANPFETPETLTLRAELTEARKPMDAIQNGYCLAHWTGQPCKCMTSPDYPAADALFRPVLTRYNAAASAYSDRRQAVYREYLRTLLRGIAGKLNWQSQQY